MNPFIYYPVKDPINQSNLFGTSNAMYTALGQKGHPGVDFEAPSGTPLYCPVDGLAVYATDKQGGDGLWIHVTTGGKNYIVILWHLYPKGDPQFPFQIPCGPWVTVKVGQLLAYTDNSGAPLESTGPHLHLGVMACNPDWSAIAPNNGYQGCIDPMPFFNKYYAQDANAIQSVITNTGTVVNSIVMDSNISSAQKIGFLQSIFVAIKKLFNE